MKKHFTALFVALGIFSAPLLYGDYQGKEFPSWKEWGSSVIPQASSNNLSDFRSNLPSEMQKSFDNASPTTQSLSIVIYNGLKGSSQNGNLQKVIDTGSQSNNSNKNGSDANSSNANLYSKAFKIANKAEIGFYMDKAARRLNYQKS